MNTDQKVRLGQSKSLIIWFGLLKKIYNHQKSKFPDMDSDRGTSAKIVEINEDNLAIDDCLD